MTQREDALVDVIAALSDERDMWRREAECMRDASANAINQRDEARKEAEDLRTKLAYGRKAPVRLSDYGEVARAIARNSAKERF